MPPILNREGAAYERGRECSDVDAEIKDRIGTVAPGIAGCIKRPDLGRDVRLECADANNQHQQRQQKKGFECHHKMAGRHEQATDDDRATPSQQAVGNKTTQDWREIGEPRIEAEKLRGEWLRVEAPKQELERRSDRAETEHRLRTAGIEKIFRHVEHDQGGIAEIGETLPCFGRKQNSKTARMTQKVVRRTRSRCWSARCRHGHNGAGRRA